MEREQPGAALLRQAGPLQTPRSSYWLPDDPSGTFERSPLWAVLLFPLLYDDEADRLIAEAEAHVAVHGWSTRRHAFHPTTDIPVAGPDVAPALHAVLRPLVDDVVLPTLALHYNFEVVELTLRDLFLVKYEAGVEGVQDRLRPHRDGCLLSFSILLSEKEVYRIPFYLTT